MLRSLTAGIALASVIGMTGVAHADDDRFPTAAELTRIEATLKAAGFTSWEEVEFDDGLWEVDDARKGDSRQEFDLKIDPESFRIASERRDD
jgi:hypothetical protein